MFHKEAIMQYAHDHSWRKNAIFILFKKVMFNKDRCKPPPLQAY